jgi:hypothetical protein
MSNNKATKPTYQSVLADVKKEMAEPRVAESAHMASQKQSAAALKEAAKS